MSKYISIIIVIIVISCIKKIEWAEGSASKEALVQNAITFISQGDNKGLLGLFLSREEHNQLFWPSLPDKFTQDRGMTADSAYDYMSMETNLSLKTMQKQFSGRELKISNVECTRPIETYGNFRLHLGCNFQIIGNKDVEQEKVRNIYGIIEYNGEFKIYNFKRN